MDTKAIRQYNERIGRTTRNKRKDESKEKKNGQGFNKIIRICSLSRLLKESFSTLITSKIEDYRKNDSSLAEKSDRDIIQHYIGKLVEYRSKMAYFAGVRGKIFFAFLQEELEHATTDSDRDQIWSNILDKNGKSILTTIFAQLCNPTCEKSKIKLMQKVIDVSNNIELLAALDIREITDSDTVFSSLASILAPQAIRRSLAIELRTSFCNNLSEELFSTLRKRIEFLVDDILSGHSKDTKKTKRTYIDQIYRKTIGLEYKEIDGITDSIDAEEFVEKSRDCLGLPHLDEYQHIMEEDKWKFIVNEKWIAFNHRYAISYLQYLLHWAIQEQKNDIQCQHSMRRPQIFPQFRADSDFTVLNLETWYHIARKFGYTFLNDDGGGWNQTRFRRAITRLQPWSIPDKPIYELAEHDFSLAYGVLSEFIDLDFVYKVFIKKPGFRGMKFNYTIATDGESCHLNFLKQNKEPGEENRNTEKRSRCKSRKVPIKLRRDIKVMKSEIKAKIASSRRLIKGLVGPACAELLEDLFDIDTLAEQLISYKIWKPVETFSEARRLRLWQRQRQRNARVNLLSPPGFCFKFDWLHGDLPTSGSGLTIPSRFNSEIAAASHPPEASTNPDGSNTTMHFLTDKDSFFICGSDPTPLFRPNNHSFLQISGPETDDVAVVSNLQELSVQMVESVFIA